MSEASPTKQKLDEFRASLPPGDALLADIKALGLKTRVTPADVKAVAEKHEKQRGKPAAPSRNAGPPCPDNNQKGNTP